MIFRRKPELVVLRLLERARVGNESDASAALDYLLGQVKSRLHRAASRATPLELLFCLTFSKGQPGSLGDELRLVYDSLYVFAKDRPQSRTTTEMRNGRLGRYIRGLAEIYGNLRIVERQRAFGATVCWDESQYCEVDGVRALGPASSPESEVKKDYARWVLRHRHTPGHMVHCKGVIARAVTEPQLSENRHAPLLFPFPQGWEFMPVRFSERVTKSPFICRPGAETLRLADVFIFLDDIATGLRERTDTEMFAFTRELGIVSMPKRYSGLDYFFRGHPEPGGRSGYDLAALTYYLDWWVAGGLSGLGGLEKKFEMLVGRLCNGSPFAPPFAIQSFLGRPLGHPNITDIDAMLIVDGVVFFVNAYAILEDATNSGLERARQNKVAVEEKLAKWEAKKLPLLAFLDTQPEWRAFRNLESRFVVCTPEPLHCDRNYTWPEEWFHGAKEEQPLHSRDLPPIFSLYELIACLEGRTISQQGASRVLTERRFDDLY